jgi:hypothetical protein
MSEDAPMHRWAPREREAVALAIEATAIKTINPKPVAQRVQLCLRVVDVFRLLDEA